MSATKRTFTLTEIALLRECASVINDNDFEGSTMGTRMLNDHFGVNLENANTEDIKTYEERVADIEDSGGMINGDDVRRLLREEAEELRLALFSERLARQNAQTTKGPTP